MKSFSLPSGMTASTVIPPPSTCAPAPIDALVRDLLDVEADRRGDVRPIDAHGKARRLSVRADRFSLLILTAPPGVHTPLVTVPAQSVAPSSIDAVFVCRAQLTETAAAMLTPPP